MLGTAKLIFYRGKVGISPFHTDFPRFPSLFIRRKLVEWQIRSVVASIIAAVFSCTALVSNTFLHPSSLLRTGSSKLTYILAQFLYGFLSGLRGHLISVTYLRRTAQSSLDQSAHAFGSAAEWTAECLLILAELQGIIFVVSRKLIRFARNRRNSLPYRLCYPDNFSHSHEMTQSEKVLLQLVGMESEIASFSNFAAVWYWRATSLELRLENDYAQLSYKLFYLTCTSTDSLSGQFLYQVLIANGLWPVINLNSVQLQNVLHAIFPTLLNRKLEKYFAPVLSWLYKHVVISVCVTEFSSIPCHDEV